MENPEVLEKILMYTGLAGLVVFGVFTLFKGIIQKNIFSSMTKEQSYSTIKLIIRGSLTLAIIGILAWGYTEIKKDEAYKNKALISKKIKGTVLSFTGDPIPNVKVALRKDESIFHETDVDGVFSLEVTGTGNKSYDLLITHPRYQNIKKLAEVDYAATELSVNLGELRLKPMREVSIPDAKTEQNNKLENNQTSYTTTQKGVFTDITVYYDPEGSGCNLDINITMGNKTYTPQSNPVQLLDVPMGAQTYTLSGTAYCPEGSCNITGSLELEIKRNGTYYLVFDPNTCYTTMLDEATYNMLKQIYY